MLTYLSQAVAEPIVKAIFGAIVDSIVEICGCLLVLFGFLKGKQVDEIILKDVNISEPSYLRLQHNLQFMSIVGMTSTLLFEAIAKFVTKVPQPGSAPWLIFCITFLVSVLSLIRLLVNGTDLFDKENREKATLKFLWRFAPICALIANIVVKTAGNMN